MKNTQILLNGINKTTVFDYKEVQKVKLVV